jgi:hypothetical protein
MHISRKNVSLGLARPDKPRGPHAPVHRQRAVAADVERRPGRVRSAGTAKPLNTCEFRSASMVGDLL